MKAPLAAARGARPSCADGDEGTGSGAAYAEDVPAALRELRELFANEDHGGAAGYASFVSEPEDDLRARRRAAGAVAEFFSALEGGSR